MSEAYQVTRDDPNPEGGITRVAFVDRMPLDEATRWALRLNAEHDYEPWYPRRVEAQGGESKPETD